MMNQADAFQTARLILRRWLPSDHEFFFKMNSNPAVIRILPKALSRKESDRFTQRIETHFETNGFGLRALELKESGDFNGFTGLSIQKFETHLTPCVEVGWRLDNKFSGKGYATEAALAALDFGFIQAKLKEIVSFAVPANLSLIAVVERIKMQRDHSCDFDHSVLPEGHALRKHVLYRRKENV